MPYGRLKPRHSVALPPGAHMVTRTRNMLGKVALALAPPVQETHPSLVREGKRSSSFWHDGR